MAVAVVEVFLSPRPSPTYPGDLLLGSPERADSPLAFSFSVSEIEAGDWAASFLGFPRG